MKGLKRKGKSGKGAEKSGGLVKNMKAKAGKPGLSDKIIEKIVSNPTDACNEWSVPKKTAKNVPSKPKKMKSILLPAEILFGGTVSSSTPRLYVRFPKSLESMELDRDQLLKLHPDITDIRIPRKKLHSKWFFAVFASEEKALAAKSDILSKGACKVYAQFSQGVQGKLKKKLKLKPDKKSLIRDWTLDKMDVANDDSD